MNLWAREGYCSFLCFRETASEELVERFESEELARFEAAQRAPAPKRKRPPPERPSAFVMASVMSRVAARLGDTLIAWLALALIVGAWVPRVVGDFPLPPRHMGFFGITHPFRAAPLLAFIGIGVGTPLFFALCHRVAGTPLKALAGIRVVTERGRQGSFFRHAVREVLGIFDAVFAGVVAFVCIAMTDQRQRLGDMIARTLVIRDSRSLTERLGRATAVYAGGLAVWSGALWLLWWVARLN